MPQKKEEIEIETGVGMVYKSCLPILIPAGLPQGNSCNVTSRKLFSQCSHLVLIVSQLIKKNHFLMYNVR